ncbi:MAG: hypothetical protein FJ109_22105, partial [Deltaproteobacteria bacterium]|nr:hypothetical protein [Deltaproteobacteria bacterium]
FRGERNPPVFDWRFRHYIRARNLVGVVQVPGLQVEILPKIDADTLDHGHLDQDGPAQRMAQSNLLFMLAQAQRVRMVDVDLSSLRLQAMPLLDTLVSIFVDRLAAELKRGVDRGYVHEEACLGVLRGKLDFSRQVRQQAVNAARFHVCYDEYILDTWMNRVLKAGCRVLGKTVSAAPIRRRLLELLNTLASVTDVAGTPEQFQKIQWNRNNERMRPCVDFVRLIMANRAPAPASGSSETFSLLFPMESLFEEFVARFIVRHASDLGLRRDRIRIQAAGSRPRLLRDEQQAGAFRLKPDVLILDDVGSSACAIDTKWKRLSSEDSNQGVTQADLYQLHAYARRFDCPMNVLLYPTGRGLSERSWTLDGEPSKRVDVRLMDLNFDFAANPHRLVEGFRRILGTTRSAPGRTAGYDA